MAGEPLITITGGRIGKDPELKFLDNGTALASMSVAVTTRKKEADKWVDDTTTWFRITQFGKDAEATVESIKKGDKVIVTGRFKMSEYVNKDQQTIQSPEVIADGIAVMGKTAPKPNNNSTDTPW